MGFPRHPSAKADASNEIVEAQGASLDAALVIEVPEEVSLRRLARTSCMPGVRAAITRVDAPPSSNWTCDVCGGEVVGRSRRQR